MIDAFLNTNQPPVASQTIAKNYSQSSTVSQVAEKKSPRSISNLSAPQLQNRVITVNPGGADSLKNTADVSADQGNNPTAKVVDTLSRANRVEKSNANDSGPGLAEELTRMSNQRAIDQYRSLSMAMAAEATSNINLVY